MYLQHEVQHCDLNHRFSDESLLVLALDLHDVFHLDTTTVGFSRIVDAVDSTTGANR